MAADAPPRAELEKIIKKTSVPFDIAVWRERMAAREVCVCRMEVPVAAGTSFGTGFLVGPDLVLTNHHVIAGATDPAAIVARFDYKARAGGGDDQSRHRSASRAATGSWIPARTVPSILQGLPKQGVPDPDLLDYALLRLAEPVGDEPIPAGKEAEPGAPARGWIALPSKPWPFAGNRSLFIIQHPSGSPMKLAMDLEATMAVNANGTRVTYQTGTEGGSSGSPCFNQLWDLVALHHAGDPSHSDFYDPAFNEGIPIDRIVARLDARGLTAGPHARLTRGRRDLHAGQVIEEIQVAIRDEIHALPVAVVQVGALVAPTHASGASSAASIARVRLPTLPQS